MSRLATSVAPNPVVQCDSEIFDQMLRATGRILPRAPGHGASLAAPHRFRFAVPHVGRSASVRHFSEEPIAAIDLQVALRPAFECDDNGHCSIPSAGNLQGIEAVAFSSSGNAVAALTPGRDWQSHCPRADEVGRGTFNQFQGKHWTVLLFADPRPYIERYGARALRHLLVESGLVSGHLSQLASASGFVSCIAGGFDDLTFRLFLKAVSSQLVPMSLCVVGKAR